MLPRGFIVLRSFFVVALATCSSTFAMQVNISASGTSYVQGEPIYVWVDYYNDSADEIGIADRYVFATNVVTIRDHKDQALKCAFESVPQRFVGGNQVQRIPAKGHLVMLTNLLDSFNIREPESYSVQISTANYKPERDLDKEHPVLSPAKMFQGRIESNRWGFTITPGSGKAFELAAMDKRWGLYGLQHYAEQIAAEYPDSPYAPYARISQVEQLLNSDGSGPKPLIERLDAAQRLFAQFRKDYSGSPLFEIASIRYADRLAAIGQNAAASAVLRELQETRLKEPAKQYVDQQLSRLARNPSLKDVGR